MVWEIERGRLGISFEYNRQDLDPWDVGGAVEKEREGSGLTSLFWA